MVTKLASGTVLAVALGAVTLYVSQSSWYGEWRVSLPGWGASGVSLAGAIGDAVCMWSAGGAPTAGHYVGPATTAATLQDLRALAEPYEMNSHVWAKLAALTGVTS